MRINYIFLTLILIAGYLDPGFGQGSGEARDKYTLLTMPYIQRPLTLYRGQFQANTGYKFTVRSRSYDNDGNVIVLKNDGNSSVLHFYYLEMKYGLTNFMEIGAGINYMKRGIRTETISIISTSNSYTVNDLKEYKGPGDLFLFTSLRLPFEYERFDVSAGAGIFVPTSPYKAEKPEHTFVTDVTTSINTINLHYKNKNGYGVPVYQINAAAKFKLSDFAFYAGFVFKDPVKEGTSIRWDEELTTSKTFSYTSNTFTYLIDRTLSMNMALHFQPTGWFNVWLNGNYTRSYGGWTEYYNLRYRNPEVYLTTLEPGFEIQISPSLIIFQEAVIPISGQNADASFSLFTSLRINLFPFLKQK